MSSANKDESVRCFEIGARFVAEGDLDKAKRFFERADRLYPNPRARECLARMDNSKKGGNAASENNETGSSFSSQRANGSFKSSHNNGNDSGGAENRPPQASAASSSNDYTKEQADDVKRIRKCKDYYEILDVPRTATDADLKKAYRKLALQFHPDKNKAPGAAEAFKAIGNAFGTLNDTEKRRRYDLYGNQDEVQSASAGGTRRRGHEGAYFEHDFSRGFEADMTPEELFNMFFGGAFTGSSSVYRFHSGGDPRVSSQHRQRGAERAEVSRYAFWLQFFPLLALVFVSLASTYFVSDPYFSLHRTSKHVIERSTRHWRIPYYVKTTFKEDYTGSLDRLEKQVEEDYVNQLQMTCYRERAAKENMLMRAQYFGSRDMYINAERMTMPACDSLKELLSPAAA